MLILLHYGALVYMAQPQELAPAQSRAQVVQKKGCAVALIELRGELLGRVAA